MKDSFSGAGFPQQQERKQEVQQQQQPQMQYQNNQQQQPAFNYYNYTPKTQEEYETFKRSPSMLQGIR
ncbi:MAG TPA: hypothetical protein PLF01_04635, partial [Alphaproteobacteria bacterium]|nr:hypothetical protein [Alphaproteobacteria bacterium]